MFKDKFKILEIFSNKKEVNSKQKIENLVVFLVLLIITIIAINTIWGEDKEKSNDEETTNSQYKQLAKSINNDIQSNNSQFLEYNLEENLEDILSKISGVGKVDVLITYSETSEVVAMYNETYSLNNTEETDTNGGNRKIDQTDRNKEIVYEEKNGEKIPITRKSYYA